MKQRVNSSWLILGLCSVLFIFVNTLTIKDGHNWGDDFSQYIRHAENIVQGKPYAGGIMLEKWVVVPPGFPLLLAPLVKLFGLNFSALKWLNVFFWQLYVIFVFLLARERLGERIALGISLVFLTAPWFFVFKQNVLSDIPFLFFITVALWSAEKYFKQGGRNFLLFALFSGGFAFIIRWAGAGFFIVWIFYVFLKNKGRETLPLVFGIVAVLLGLQAWLGVSASNHIKELSVPPALFVRILLEYVPGVFHSILEFFVPPVTVFARPILQFTAELPGAVTYVFLGAVFVFFIRGILKRNVSFMAVFSILYLLGIFLWPIKGGEGRYIFPLLLPVSIAAGAWILKIKITGARNDFFLQCVIGLIIAHNILSTALCYDFNDDQIYKPQNRELADWVRENLAEDEHYMFSKPRALGILTDRLGATYGSTPRDRIHWEERIEPLKVKYLIISKENQSREIAQVEGGIVAAALVWENPAYKIFKISRVGE